MDFKAIKQMRKCLKPAHLNKKEQNDGIVGMLEASFHIEQTTPRLSVSSPKDRWSIFKSWNQTNQTRWQKIEGTINVGLHQALDSAFLHIGLFCSMQNLCVVNLAVVSCCLFLVSETKPNQTNLAQNTKKQGRGFFLKIRELHELHELHA